jgi:hypothetical protein
LTVEDLRLGALEAVWRNVKFMLKVEGLGANTLVYGRSFCFVFRIGNWGLGIEIGVGGLKFGVLGLRCGV